MKFFSVIILILIILSFPVAAQNDAVSEDYQYALIEAVKQKNLGNYPDAIKLYKLVIKEKENVAVAHYELGTIYLMSNQLGTAEMYLGNAYRLDPSNYWYIGGYIEALVANEKFEEAGKILKYQIRQSEDNVEYIFQLARVYLEADKARKSLKLLDRIEKENGISEKVTLMKATVHESMGKYDLAREEIDRVISFFPESLQFRIVAAELCLKSGEEDDAAEYYRQVFEIDSTNIFAITNLTDYYRKKEDYANSFFYLKHSFDNPRIDRKRKLAILSYYLSDETYVSNFGKELEDLVSAYIENYPEDNDGKLIAVDFYIQRRGYEKAFELINEYLKSASAPYPIWMQAILLANAAGLNAELVDVTGRALELYKDSTDILFFRSLGFYGMESYQDVISTLDTVDFENYTNGEYAKTSSNLLAESFYREGMYEKSDSIFERVIEKDPSDYISMNNYSFYLSERSVNLEKAKLLSFVTIKDNPDNHTFLDTYAWVLYKMEDFVNAEKYIREALNKGGENDPEINEHAGDIQFALGSFSLAKKYYEKAIILGGDKERILEKIERLKDE